MKMLSMWIAFLGVSVLSAPTGAETKTTRVLVWDERQPAQLEAYDNYLGNAIAEHLGKNPALEVTSLHLDAPSQGLSNEILEKTDVLVLWSHIRKSEVSQESGQRVARRIQQGKLSLVALHSSHWASPFVEAMNLRAQADARKKFKARPGQTINYKLVPPPSRYVVPAHGSMSTPAYYAIKKRGVVTEVTIHLPICCFPDYRHDGEPSTVEVLLPDHPIAKGLPGTFQISRTEMYNEPFHVPPPDEVLFKETWKTGEWFRSGCVWKIGKGRVFYFRPGHETYPVFKQAECLRVVENACLWLGGEKKETN